MSVEEIGQRLKLARDNSGLSLSQINERTKIPFNHLESIEKGHFDDLPEPVYVAGFIKRYADCVGLNSQQMVDEYRQELDNQIAKPEKSHFLFKNNKNRPASPPPPSYYNRQPLEQAPPNLMKLIPFYAFFIVLILGLIIYLFNRQESIDLAQQDPGILALRQSANKSHDINNNENNKVQGGTSSGRDPNSPQGDNNDSNNSVSGSESTDTSKSANNEVNLLAKKHVWVEVKATSSGEALYTGFMEAGTTHTFNDAEGLHIRAGNGGNLQVSYAGKTEDLGLNGKISEKTYSTNQASKTVYNSTNTEYQSPSVKYTESSNNSKKTAEKPSQNSTDKTLPKKPLVAASTKKTSSTISNAPPLARRYATGEGDRALDVPYRYSE